MIGAGSPGGGGPPAVAVGALWSAVAGHPGPRSDRLVAGALRTEQPYTTNMGYTKVFGYPHLLFPGSVRWVLAAGAVGVVAMVVRRNRVALFLVVMGGAVGPGHDRRPGLQALQRPVPAPLVPVHLPVGRLRAGRGGGARRPLVAPSPAQPVGPRSVRARLGSTDGRDWSPGMRVTPYRRPVPVAVAAGAVVGPARRLWPRSAWPWCRRWSVRSSTLAKVGITVGADQPSAWAEWNYSGYERKPDYPEFQAVMQMMPSVGADQGCGRAMWEYDPTPQPVRDDRVADAPARTSPTAASTRWRDCSSSRPRPPRSTSSTRTNCRPIRRTRWSPTGLHLRRPQRGPRDPAPPADGCPVPAGLVDHRATGGGGRPERHPGRLDRPVEHQLQRRAARHHLEGVPDLRHVAGGAAGQPAGGVEGRRAEPSPAG